MRSSCVRTGAQVVQDRLAALELMLLQKPIVSGQFTSHAFRHFVVPLDPYFRKVIARCAQHYVEAGDPVTQLCCTVGCLRCCTCQAAFFPGSVIEFVVSSE